MDINDLSNKDYRMIQTVFNAALALIQALFGNPLELHPDSTARNAYYLLNQLCLEFYDAENQMNLEDKINKEIEERLNKANEHQESDS